MRVVISQPMFFPWVGMFEQIKLSDCFIFYDDVQFSSGGFINRVQIKTPEGIAWMTVPLKKYQLGTNIVDIKANHAKDWKQLHLNALERGYKRAPYYRDMIELVERTHNETGDRLAEICELSTKIVCQYFNINTETDFLQSSELGVPGKSSQRVLDIIKNVNGDAYITGHGARKYLDHSIFEDAGVEVEYMNYNKTPYPQMHGDFTPYVSILDLIANMGPNGVEVINSGTVGWKEYLNEQE